MNNENSEFTDGSQNLILDIKQSKYGFSEGGSEPSDSDPDDFNSLSSDDDFSENVPDPVNMKFYDLNQTNTPTITNKDSTIQYRKLSYNAVRKQVNKYYDQDTVHKYSSALDILASYLKGQKIIYMESRNSTVTVLNRLMLPAILLSSLCSVLAPLIDKVDYGSFMLATINAAIAFLLAIINYLKLGCCC